MLTTVTESGKHVSRPMALQEVEFDRALWFFCYDDSARQCRYARSPK
jgi:general stress protein 26